MRWQIGRAGDGRASDGRQRERDALELNDNVLQTLVVAKLAFELGQHERGMAALESSIHAASTMISELLGGHRARHGNVMLRTQAAMVDESS